MEEKLPIRRGVYILPNLFTTASLFTGFMALVWASQGEFQLSAMGILFSALMDGLDGKVARLTNTSSEFGVQYDSLADLAAFGVAPGFMIYVWMLKDFGSYGSTAAFLFATCAALRLARFNVAAASGGSKKFFIGLPTPAAGCTLATFVFFEPHLPNFLQPAIPAFALILTLLTGCLMVSRVRYYAFKEFGVFTAHKFRAMVITTLLFALIIAAPKVLGFLIVFGYIIVGIVYTFVFLPKKGHLPLNKMMP